MRFTNRQLVIAGWLLFIISALGFMWSSLKNGDIPGLIGSVFFLAACIVFLIPFLRRSM